MAWRRPGDKPLSEPMMIRLPTHIFGLSTLVLCDMCVGPVVCGSTATSDLDTNSYKMAVLKRTIRHWSRMMKLVLAPKDGHQQPQLANEQEKYTLLAYAKRNKLLSVMRKRNRG